MIANGNNIFIFILAIALGGFSYKNDERGEVTKEYDQYIMHDVLKSLLRLNEARYNNMKKLNHLNTVHYLRTSTKDGYNFTNLLSKLKSVFKLLSVKPNQEINEANLSYYDVYYNDIYILTIPIPSNIGGNVLRTKSDESVSEENNEKVIDNTSSDGKSVSDENNDIIKKNGVNVNKPLRYRRCRKGRQRCYYACKEAYITACFLTWCKDSFIHEMRSASKYECEERFY